MPTARRCRARHVLGRLCALPAVLAVGKVTIKAHQSPRKSNTNYTLFSSLLHFGGQAVGYIGSPEPTGHVVKLEKICHGTRCQRRLPALLPPATIIHGEFCRVGPASAASAGPPNPVIGGPALADHRYMVPGELVPPYGWGEQCLQRCGSNRLGVAAFPRGWRTDAQDRRPLQKAYPPRHRMA